MKQLLDSIAEIISLFPPEKVEAIAKKLQQDIDPIASLRNVSGAPTSQNAIEKLIAALQQNLVSADELAAMFLSANHIYKKARDSQSIELVWTGPKTPFVSPRRTEQALLEVINAAEKHLFLVSFVAYKISSIMKALNEAIGRGVRTSILMELSQDHGGSVSFDTLGAMKAALPKANFYVWQDKTEEFDDGRVHAKIVVADGNKCFITSANLTGHAMEKNMEAGILIAKGDIPRLLADHLQALIDTNTISSI